MRRFNVLILILLAMLMVTPDIYGAPRRKRRKKKKESPVTSVFDAYVGGGYSSLLHKIDNSSIPGGGAGMFGVGYMMQHKSKFQFRVGVEGMYLNSTTKMNNLHYEGTYKYTGPGIVEHPIKYVMDLENYRESQNRISLNIPLMFGMQIQRYYFLLGAKAGLGLVGMYNTKANAHTVAIDEMLVDPMTGMPNHTLSTYPAKGSGALKFGLDVTASAEVGISLDEWMPAGAKQYGRGKTKKPISYRVGLFADCGVMNINSNASNAMLFGREENGGVVVDDVENITLNSALSLRNRNTGKVNALNSLVVGAKFTLLFPMIKKEKPVKKKRRPRPRPKNVNTITDPTFFYCVVTDFETDKYLDANVFLYTLDEKRDTVFQTLTTVDNGFAEKEMKNNQYGIKVTRDGYVDFIDTLYQVASDTLYVEMYPIKRDEVIILRNLNFETDKTTIMDISASSLEELYTLMLENPDMRIEITGHTDNVGKRRYNKKLSEGRAKAVFDEMVRRGIAPDRMEWKGMGDSDPIESNDTEEGRAENRRVQFRIL